MKFAGIIAASAALMVCCSKDASYDDVATDPSTQQQGDTNPSIVSGEVLDSFGAKFENDVNTKVSITIDKEKAKAKLDFEGGVDPDAVLVVSGSSTAKYVYDGEKFVPDSTPLTLDENVEVYYPFDEFKLDDSNNVVFTMPAAVTDLSDLGTKNPLAGKIVNEGGYKVTMKAVGSILKVDVTGALAISGVKLQNAGGSRMPLGPDAHFTIGWNADEPTMAANESASNSEMTVSRNVTLSDTPQTFYYIVPAGVAYTNVSVLADFSTGNIGGQTYFEVSRGNWTADRNKVYTMSFYAGLFSGGAGTQEDPYKIANARDFKNIATYCANGYGYDPTKMISAADFLDAYYQQTADINLNNATLTPIGSESAPFTGVYDGNSSKLENVSISTTSNDTGLFAYLDGATVKDLTVSGSIQSSKSNVGSIAGRANGASILRCVNQATVKSTANSSTNAAVGGIVGQANQTSPVTIESCANEGAASGAIFLGGIVGDINGTVDKCVNKANVTGSSSNVGGIAGSIRGNSIVRRCYSSKGIEIKGTNRVGGIVGVVNSGDDDANTTWVVNCFSNSNVTGTSNSANFGVGGLVGYITKGFLANGATGDVTVKCSASCTDKKKAAVYVGGIVGYLAAGGTIQNVYSPLYAKDIKIGSVHGRSGSGKIGQIVGYTAGTLIGYYFGGCATATTGWQYWGTDSSSTTTAQFAITTANNVSFDWTGPVQKMFEVTDWGVSLNAGEYYMSDLMNVAITRDPLESQYTKADGEVLTWSPIDGTNTTDTHPIPNSLIALGEDYYKN